MDLKAKITAYKNYLLIEATGDRQDAHFIPANHARVGCIVIGTKDHLGVSKEAMALLKKVPKSIDDVGDVMVWKSGDNICFGWLGGLKSIKNATKIESDRYGITDFDFVEIPNEAPTEAVEAIKKAEGKK